MIRVEGVSFRYRPDGPLVLDGVSLSIEPGEVVALLGANGSGKSTLVRMLNAMSLPLTGEVTVDGMSTRDPDSTRRIRECVGAVYQQPDDQIVATAVEDDVAFGPENLGLPRDEIRRRVDEALATVGLTGLERREPHVLSGGQKQRLVIAGALAMEPRYLVLDEPTSMLDPKGRAEVLDVIETLRGEGRGILFVTHDLSAIAQATRAVVLSGGRVVFEGAVDALYGNTRGLGRWGLEEPPLERLSRSLGAAGFPTGDGIATVDSVVSALCR